MTYTPPIWRRGTRATPRDPQRKSRGAGTVKLRSGRGSDADSAKRAFRAGLLAMAGGALVKGVRRRASIRSRREMRWPASSRLRRAGCPRAGSAARCRRYASSALVPPPAKRDRADNKGNAQRAWAARQRRGQGAAHALCRAPPSPPCPKRSRADSCRRSAPSPRRVMRPSPTKWSRALAAARHR